MRINNTTCHGVQAVYEGNVQDGHIEQLRPHLKTSPDQQPACRPPTDANLPLSSSSSASGEVGGDVQEVCEGVLLGVHLPLLLIPLIPTVASASDMRQGYDHPPTEQGEEGEVEEQVVGGTYAESNSIVVVII